MACRDFRLEFIERPCHLVVRIFGFQPKNTGSTPVRATVKPKNPTKYRKALKLRSQGKSYGEIKKTLGIPKSTQSGWFKNLKLPPSVQRILEEKGRTTREFLMRFNRERTKRIQKENKEIKRKALQEISKLSKRELILIGAALYWGEGYKTQKNKEGLQLSNSDPYLIALFLRFLREVIEIPEEKFRVRISIHPNISAQSAIDSWSKITNLPKERFYITDQISRASGGKRPRNSLPYDTLDLRVTGRKDLFKVKGWIDGLKHQSGLI